MEHDRVDGRSALVGPLAAWRPQVPHADGTVFAPCKAGGDGDEAIGRRGHRQRHDLIAHPVRG